jgi:hypothetical protein
MRFPRHARMSVTRRGEKELRLGAFLARGLDGLAARTQGAAPAQAPQNAVAAIARSVHSPVVKSIVARAHGIAAAGGAVRLIIARPDGPALADALAAVRAAELACEVRLAGNPRLAWTGDTMRRDPATCDAYECFVEDCPEIAAAAAATFERLWRDSAPLAAGGALATGAIESPWESVPAGPLTRRA